MSLAHVSINILCHSNMLNSKFNLLQLVHRNQFRYITFSQLLCIFVKVVKSQKNHCHVATGYSLLYYQRRNLAILTYCKLGRNVSLTGQYKLVSSHFQVHYQSYPQRLSCSYNFYRGMHPLYPSIHSSSTRT